MGIEQVGAYHELVQGSNGADGGDQHDHDGHGIQQLGQLELIFGDHIRGHGSRKNARKGPQKRQLDGIAEIHQQIHLIPNIHIVTQQRLFRQAPDILEKVHVGFQRVNQHPYEGENQGEHIQEKQRGHHCENAFVQPGRFQAKHLILVRNTRKPGALQQGRACNAPLKTVGT